MSLQPLNNIYKLSGIWTLHNIAQMAWRHGGHLCEGGLKLQNAPRTFCHTRINLLVTDLPVKLSLNTRTIVYVYYSIVKLNSLSLSLETSIESHAVHHQLEHPVLHDVLTGPPLPCSALSEGGTAHWVGWCARSWVWRQRRAHAPGPWGGAALVPIFLGPRWWRHVLTSCIAFNKKTMW